MLCGAAWMVAGGLCARADVSVSFNESRTVADFAFETATWARKVYVVYGSADCGSGTSGWERVEQVGVAPAGATSLTGVAMPDGFDADALVMRALVERDPTSRDYVQDGLVAHFDALDNAGVGQHAATLTEWVDLKGANNLPLVETDTVAADYLSIGPTIHTTANELFSSASTPMTLEGAFCVVSAPASSSSLTGVNAVAVPASGRLGLELRTDMKPVRFIKADLQFRWPANPYANITQLMSSGCYEYCALRTEEMIAGSMTVADGSCRIDGEEKVCSVSDYVSKTPPTGLTGNLQVGNAYGTLRFRAIRVYARTLTDGECDLNYALDRMRYEGGDRVPLFQSSECVGKRVPLSVTRVVKTGETVTGLELEFTATNHARRMFLGWSRQDLGGNVRDWTNRVELGSVAAGIARQSFEVPSDASEALIRNGYRVFLERLPTAADYVRDDLLVQYDAIENAGFGQHDEAAEIWKDLVGSRDLTLVSGDAVSSNSVRIGTTVHTTTGDLFSKSTDPMTLEASFAVASYGSSYGAYIVTVPMVGSISWETRSDMRPLRFMQNKRIRWPLSNYMNLDAFVASGRYAYCSFRPRLMVTGSTTDDGSVRVDGVARLRSGAADYDITVNDDYTLSAGNTEGNLDFRSIRVYGRTLEPEEQALNYDIDQVRFEGADTLCFAETTSFARERGTVLIFR